MSGSDKLRVNVRAELRMPGGHADSDNEDSHDSHPGRTAMSGQQQPSLGWAGPAQSELLTHFCGRPQNRPATTYVPKEIAGLQPWEKLDAILGSEQILGFPPFGADRTQPMVCFSESPMEHLRHLLGERGWRPWGLVVMRAFVYAQDGGPVWYARPPQRDHLRSEQLPWIVPFGKPDGGFVDWTHEREWRVPGESLGFDADDVVAVLVGDPGWKPSPVEYTVIDGYVNGITGEECDPGEMYAMEYTSSLEDSPMTWLKSRHWYWDGSTVIDLGTGSPA